MFGQLNGRKIHYRDAGHQTVKLMIGTYRPSAAAGPVESAVVTILRSLAFAFARYPISFRTGMPGLGPWPSECSVDAMLGMATILISPDSAYVRHSG